MSLSPVKQEILETMLLNEKPMKAIEVASESKKEFPPTMMHLLGLARMGYVTSPEKGQYAITERGKNALGVPEITKVEAKAILSYAAHEKAFNFYLTEGKPLSLHAHNLWDFANKLNKVDLASVEFHLQRGDFEAWFKMLGDLELVKKTNLLKKKHSVGEEMRKQLRAIVEQRYLNLAKLADQPIPSEQ